MYGKHQAESCIGLLGCSVGCVGSEVQHWQRCEVADQRWRCGVAPRQGFFYDVWGFTGYGAENQHIFIEALVRLGRTLLKPKFERMTFLFSFSSTLGF